MTQTEAICRCQCHEGQAVDAFGSVEEDCSICCQEPAANPMCGFCGVRYENHERMLHAFEER